jgi:hypothetical protein
VRLVDGEIRDVLGARKLPIRFGARLTIVAGANGTGKSTIARAVRATLEGGQDIERLVNVTAGEGAEPAVVLRGTDGGRPYTFERVPRRVSVSRAALDEHGAVTAAMEPVPKAGEYVRSLLPASTVDVVGLLGLKGDALATMILQACPLKMERAELLAAMGLGAEELERPIPKGLHPLVECDFVKAEVFDRRRDVNRDAKSARETADQLLRTIPKDVPADLGPAIAQLEAARLQLEREIAAEETRVRADEAAAVSAAATAAEALEEKRRHEHQVRARQLKTDHEEWAAKQRRIVEAAIAANAAKVEGELELLRAATTSTLESIAQERDAAIVAAGDARAQAQTALQPKREQLTKTAADLAAMREQDKRGEGDRRTRQTADEKKAEADSLKEQADRLTAALDALEEFRRGMAQRLPIPGLSILGDAITVDGVPWEQLNEAQRVRLLVKLVVLGAEGAKLPLIVVDQAEKLVGDNWVALLRELAASPVQALVCRAEPHPLEVIAVDEPADLDAYLARSSEAVA